MTKSSLVRQLDYHQQRISSILRWATPLLEIAAVTSEVAAEMMARRMKLSRLLMDYALFKHRDSFEPVIAGGGVKGAEAMRLKLACIDAGEAYRDYTKAAGPTRPLAQWSTYRVTALAMAEAIRDHLAQERSGIRKLLSYHIGKVTVSISEESVLAASVPEHGQSRTRQPRASGG
jgi:hypothetical protein